MPAVLLLGKFLLKPRALQAFSFIYQDMENFGFGDGDEWVKGSHQGSIQEDITSINTYGSNIGASQYVRKIVATSKG